MARNQCPAFVGLSRYLGTMTTHSYPVVVGAPGLPPPSAPAPAAGWPPTAQPPSLQKPGPPRRVGLWVLAVVATVCSIAALVLGALALSKVSQMKAAASGALPTTPLTAPAAPPQLFDDAADRGLCQAIPDLMRERNKADKAFQALPSGSPESKAAIPAYKSGVQDWAMRMEAVLAAHAQPDRYLTRTLQRYIDDLLLYAQNIYPNKTDPFDQRTWDLNVVDYGGALGRCYQLGIGWQS